MSPSVHDLALVGMLRRLVRLGTAAQAGDSDGLGMCTGQTGEQGRGLVPPLWFSSVMVFADPDQKEEEEFKSPHAGPGFIITIIFFS